MSVRGALARNLPNYDAAGLPKKAHRASFSPSERDRAKIRPGTEVQTDERLGLPTFLWTARREAGAGHPLSSLAGLRPEDAARRHLAEYASLYDLDAGEVRAAVLGSVHDTGEGVIIVTFHQAVDGIEVFRDEIKIAMDRSREPIAIAGYIVGKAHFKGTTGRPAFTLGAPEAIAAAFLDLTGVPMEPGDLEKSGQGIGGYDFYDLTPHAQALYDPGLARAARVRKTLFRLPDHLEAAYFLEIDVAPRAGNDSDYYSYVISAVDGRLLFRNNLTRSDAFSYRVWADGSGLHLPFDGPQGTAPTPHPSGFPDGSQAPFVAPLLVSLQNGPIGSNDPWLPAGATVTTGNNVEAYADLAAPDGFSVGDVRATTTGPNAFDRAYDTSREPQASADQEMAAITQLFYDINFFHDWYYDVGFNEDAGNAQTSNYGRGGLENDSLKAEAQDSGGRNNANMSTPGDGARPRMQMYLWDGDGRRSLVLNAPSPGVFAVGTALFGPQAFTTKGDVVLVDDGVVTDTDGCQTPFLNAATLAGKIALIDRGNCGFTVKVKNAQINGAIGAIIANNQATGLVTMSGTDATITVPSLFITLDDGNTIRSLLSSQVVNVTLVRDPLPDRDGTIDNQIVAHEWAHYLTNRLIGDGSGLSNNQGGSMGEGWSDFNALLMTVRPEDAAVPSNPSFSGVYGVAGYVQSGGPNGPLPNNAYYFGIRRVPYSTDFSKDPLTFRHVANGVPLPDSAPIAFGASGSNNAEVHSSGEVWATMLWECYASLLRDTARLTFDRARDRMRAYLVAAFKLTPITPTFLEARDALLVAAYARDAADFALFSQAFARRGAGLRAVAPDRYSTTHQGVVESYLSGNDLAFVGAALDDNVTWCDHDGFLDDLETGRLTITLRNVGTGNLGATTGTVTTTTPGVSFPNGGALTFPTSRPFGTTTASVNVRLTGASGVQPIDFSVAFSDPATAIPGTMTAGWAGWGNVDDVPDRSATDDVESNHAAWTLGSDPVLDPSGPWRRIEITGRDHRWLGPDPSGTSDQYLVSPDLRVAPTGSFGFTFRHRYSFEFAASPSVENFDGGVIEITQNNGATWTDIGALASPGYTGPIATGGGNPIEGRNAFCQTSPGYPAFTSVTVNLGTAYAGQTVKIRFRLGTDVFVGAPGWEIDDVAFSNITNLPFHALVPDRALCIDSDSDGVLDPTDCAPFDPSAWAVPTEARNLLLSGTIPTTLGWTAPASPGGTSTVYDVLRSGVASSFAPATCILINGAGLLASDTGLPSRVFYYLVRSENVCGGNLGTDSSGNPHTGASCP